MAGIDGGLGLGVGANAAQGWQCPQCGVVYAPTVQSCTSRAHVGVWPSVQPYVPFHPISPPWSPATMPWALPPQTMCSIGGAE